MKKLLGILGTITIVGSGTAGIVGNAPASAKNEINFLQTNNLKKLNRNKRSPQYNPVTGQGGQQQLYNPQTGGGGQQLSNPPWNFNLSFALPTKDKTTKKLDGGMFDFGLNLGQRVHTYNPINPYQQQPYQQQPYQQQPLIQSTYNPNQNIDQIRQNRPNFRDRINERFPNYNWGNNQQ